MSESRVHVASVTLKVREEANDAMESWYRGDAPESRLENGLRIAAAWTQKNIGGIDEIDQQRLEAAYARIIARENAEGSIKSEMGSIDYARALIVDASLNREAAIALSLDVIERKEHLSLVNSELNDRPWHRSGTSPSELAMFGTSELTSIASDFREHLLPYPAQKYEIMQLRGVSPRDADLDKELAHIDEILFYGREYVRAAEFGPAADMKMLQDRSDMRDLDRFGMGTSSSFQEKTIGEELLTRDEMKGLVDRVGLAHQTDLYRERKTSMGTDMFRRDPDKDGLQYAVVSDVTKGEVRSPLQQSTRIALEFMKGRGINLEDDGLLRMDRAVHRLVSSRNAKSFSDQGAAKRLIVDCAIQMMASDKLEPKHRITEARAGITKAEKMLKDLVGEGSYPVFTRLASERPDTLAAAEGRFEDLSDKHGFASIIEMGLHRSDRKLGGDVALELIALEKTNPVGKEPDRDWMDRKDNRSMGEIALKAFSKGPENQQFRFPEMSMER